MNTITSTSTLTIADVWQVCRAVGIVTLPTVLGIPPYSTTLPDQPEIIDLPGISNLIKWTSATKYLGITMTVASSDSDVSPILYAALAPLSKGNWLWGSRCGNEMTFQQNINISAFLTKTILELTQQKIVEREDIKSFTVIPGENELDNGNEKIKQIMETSICRVNIQEFIGTYEPGITKSSEKNLSLEISPIGTMQALNYLRNDKHNLTAGGFTKERWNSIVKVFLESTFPQLV